MHRRFLTSLFLIVVALALLAVPAAALAAAPWDGSPVSPMLAAAVAGAA